MTKDTPVSAIMTKKVIVADLDTKFTQIQKLFTEYHIYHLPVVFDDKLLGIVSVQDALETYAENYDKLDEWNADKINEKFKVNDIMTHDPVTVHYDDTLGDVVEILATAKFRSLPVTDNDGKIVGIISNKDLVKILKNLL